MAVRPIDANALHAEISKWPESVMYKDWVQSAIANAPTLTPPNEPLIPDELREMDGEPVWFDTIKRWGIVRVCGYGISVLTKSGEYDVTRMKFYRRPPEGEADA